MQQVCWKRSTTFDMYSELFHDSCQYLLLSPHPLHSLFSAALFPPRTSICCSLHIPCTLCSALLCSLLLPVFAALSTSLALSVRHCSVPSSYQCLLLSPHLLHSLFCTALFPPPTSVCCSLHIPCTLCSALLCSLLLPVFAALSTSLALSVHSSYQYLLLSPHPLHSLIFLLCSVSLLVAELLLLCLFAAALLVSVTSCIEILLSYAACRVPTSSGFHI